MHPNDYITVQTEATELQFHLLKKAEGNCLLYFGARNNLSFNCSLLFMYHLPLKASPQLEPSSPSTPISLQDLFWEGLRETQTAHHGGELTSFYKQTAPFASKDSAEMERPPNPGLVLSLAAARAACPALRK